MRKHIIVCFSGFAGVGKDEACKHLVNKYNALHTGLVDPAKRHLHELYGFSELQLFGPSKYRNLGDLRYPKKEFHDFRIQRWEQNGTPCWGTFTLLPDHKSTPAVGGDFHIVEEGDPRFWLSPREALQRYAELMNLLYKNSWINKGIQVHQEYFVNSKSYYSRMKGIYYGEERTEDKDYFISCFSDFRHLNEIEFVKNLELADTRVILVRIKHPVINKPPFDHKSETDQVDISDSIFDHIIDNDGTILDLQRKLDNIICNSLR
jgi:hypothetical protein